MPPDRDDQGDPFTPAVMSSGGRMTSPFGGRMTSPGPSRTSFGPGVPRPSRRGRVTEDQLREFYRFYLGRPPDANDIETHLTGGFRDDPTGLEESIANSEEAMSFMQQSFFGGGEEMGGGFEGFGPSEAELRYLNLLGDQITEQIRLDKESNARTKARREFLDKEIRTKYGVGLEEFEGQEALRAAGISRQQSERMEKALKGELPIDPALERQIGEDEKQVRQKLLDQVGPGYETSTPGIESLATFRQRSEELRSAARRGEIDAGLGPAAASAQFGLSLIGSEGTSDTTSIAQALQAATSQRQTSIEANRVRSSALLGMQELALRQRIASMENSFNRDRFDRGGSSRDTEGAGYGRLGGTILGTAAGAYLSMNQRRRGTSSANDPLYT